MEIAVDASAAAAALRKEEAIAWYMFCAVADHKFSNSGVALTASMALLPQASNSGAFVS